MIKGIVPDFGYDVKLAITVDQEKQDNIPESDATKENKYYRVGVSCSNDVKGEWDYNAWNLKLNNVVEGTKCNLTFTSNMSKEEHDNIIKEGVSLRRNTYRGKDITSYYEEKEKINNRDLYEQISNCTFDDIYVGDYIKTNTNGKEVTWLIADLNNYLYTGSTPLTTCHATIIPAEPLTTGQMNENNTSVGAYYQSKMKQEILPSILAQYITPIFENHIIDYYSYLSTAIDANRSNMQGNNDGSTTAGRWVKSNIDLMSEVNVFGTTIVSSAIYDIGIDNQQYALFQLKPEFSIMYNTKNITYWLKGVVNQRDFNSVYNGGLSAANNASEFIGVRPRFLID